jgi:hypothetical protein
MPVLKTTPPGKGREAIRIVKPFSSFIIDSCTAGVLPFVVPLVTTFGFFHAFCDKHNCRTCFVLQRQQQQLTVDYRSQDPKLVIDKFYYVKSHR